MEEVRFIIIVYTTGVFVGYLIKILVDVTIRRLKEAKKYHERQKDD